MFELNYQKKSDEIIEWIVGVVHKAGFTDVVIALSGGIDSAVSATLSVKALGKEHVHVLLLPYGLLSKKSTEDAKKMVKSLGLPEENIHEIDIKESVDSVILGSEAPNQKSVQGEAIPESGKSDPGQARMTNISKGNIMARTRMIYLYDLAKKINALVVGTENKSEYYLSYFTRFGDEASDIEPIRSLYKTQVWEMGKFLGIPKEIIEKAPSAGLWEGQSDEGEFGFSYLDADIILYHHFDEGLSEEKIVKLGISEETVRKVLAWVERNDFKHKLPYIF